MKIFVICPVRSIDPYALVAIEMYVKSLELKGHQVHWPPRDTEQVDPTGGYEICRTNFKAILEADQVHIWYDEKSSGSKFDMGGVFMLVEMLGYNKRIFIINSGAVIDDKDKSFYKVFQRIAD